MKWLSNLKGDELSNVRYAVFGCGNHDWVSTYQRIPQLVDRLLGERGGKPLVPRGEGDAGGADLFQDFDDWEIKLFQTLSEVCILHVSGYMFAECYRMFRSTKLLRLRLLRCSVLLL